MPTIRVNLTNNQFSNDLSGFNNFRGADVIGTGLLSSDLLDDAGASTGISLTEGAQAFTSSGVSTASADSSPDPDYPSEFFRTYWSSGSDGEKFILAGFSAGASYTLEIAGHNPGERDTLFYATNSDPASATYVALADPDPDPFVPNPPITFTGTANASGEIRIGADIATSISRYGNGFSITYTESSGPTITDINTNNEVIPGTTATLTGTNLTGATGFNIGSESQTDFTVVSDTSITFTTVRGGNPYNQDLTGTLLHPDGNQTITLQQVPEAGTFAVTAASPNTTDDASLWSGLVDTATGDPVTVVDGDQALIKSGPTGVAVDPDGTITADETGDLVVQFWRASEGVWGSDQTVSFVVPGGGVDPVDLSGDSIRSTARDTVRDTLRSTRRTL